MRKVTASAVILTALTGCSQSSSIPSTQWSFEVPSDEEMASGDASAATLVSSELVASASSADAPSSLAEVVENGRKAGRDRLMGPAFEQPEADIPSGAKLSTVGRPGSKEMSSLTGETYGLASGLASTPTSTRPDPVAQVRAYLRSSGSPSALTNRTPYTSQVYLSSLPVPNQYYTPLVSVADSPSALASPDFGPADSLASNSLASISSVANMDASLGTREVASSPEAPEAVFSTPSFSVPDLSAASSGESQAVSYKPDTPALSEPIRFEDGLPQLISSVPSSVPASISEAASIPEAATASELPAEDMPAENISIGTSILNNLQRSSAEAANYDTAASRYQPMPPVQTMPALANSAPPLPLSETAPSQISLSQVPLLEVSLSQVPPSQTERSLPNTSLSATLSEPASDTDISERPNAAALAVADPASLQSASQRATLTSLTETMPSRELSPLVASYRAAKNLAPISDEASTDYPATQQPAIQQPVIQPSNTSLSPDAPSPLLQSFGGDTDVSTLYVPIAEAAPSDVSGTLIKAAIGALEEEVSTSDFLTKLLEQGPFSSVLSSPTLSSATASQADFAPATPSLAAPSVGATVPSISQRIPLSLKQPSKRRQRVMWL